MNDARKDAALNDALQAAKLKQPLASLKPFPNAALRQLARHALGLPSKSKQSYRNRFLAGPKDLADWRKLATLGLTNQLHKTRYGTWFQLTTAGAIAALDPGETLCPEDFPTLANKEAHA